MKTFSQFQEDIRYRDPSARGGFDPRFDRVGKPDLGRGPNRWRIPDRSPTLGMDKMERNKQTKPVEEQLVPTKVDTPLDLRGPGPKLRDLQLQRKKSDSSQQTKEV